jgi:hypothetical protein
MKVYQFLLNIFNISILISNIIQVLGRNKILDKLGYSLFGNITFASNNIICQEEKKLDGPAIFALYSKIYYFSFKNIISSLYLLFSLMIF